MQYSTTVRNAKMDAIETAIGTSAIIKIYDGAGSQPINPAAAVVGALLCTYNLASNWMAAASAGGVTLNSLPILGTALADGVPNYFRIWDSAGTTCHAQGYVSIAGLGGDMIVSIGSVALGGALNITGFTLTDGNP